MDLEEEDEKPDDDGGDSESAFNACVSVLKEDEIESVEDQIEKDVVCAFLSSGWDGRPTGMCAVVFRAAH